MAVYSSSLLRGSDGHLHLMQRVLANGRVFLLLAAVLTVTRTRRKRNRTPCSRQELHLDTEVAGHAEPQASQRSDPFPVRRAGPHQARQDRPGATRLVPAGPSGDRPAGVWRNT
jgi:hypothetical protein